MNLKDKLSEVKKKYPIGVYDKKGHYRVKVVSHKIETHNNKQEVVISLYYTNNPNSSKHQFGLSGKFIALFMNGYKLIK